MRMYRYVPALLALLALGAAPVSAQDAGKNGITMGYPASIGFIWHTSDKVAVRPEISFAGASSGTTASSLAIDSDTWTVGTGVSVLLYLHDYDRLRTYVSPRLTYAHTSGTSSSSSFTSTESTTTSNSLGVSGSFGAQYGLSDKFGVFGEVGFGFGRTTSSGSLNTALKGHSTSWGTRSGVGVIFYF